MSLHSLMLANARERRDSWRLHSPRWLRWDIEVRFFAARLIGGSYA